ncbi:MAG: MexX family efflux pump subunit [Nitrospirales bacterium]|nr:MAG: MexX family efflux pump subunit [Nitrospirales bacterium]
MKVHSPSNLSFALLVLMLLGLTACQQEAGPPPAPLPPEVKVITVVPKTIPDEVEFIGQTDSFRPVEIRSQVTGIIKKVFFTEGRDVKKGDRLYLIDPIPFKAAAGSARGQVGQAVARLAQARAELARVKPLLDEQAVSQKDVDDAIAEELAAESALVSAKADFEKAKFDLKNTLIVAPVSGRIERSQLYEGRLVSAQTDLLTSIRQMDPMYVNVNVPESYILRRQRELSEQRVERPDLFELRGIMTMADGTTYPHEGTLDFAGTGFRSETGSLQSRFVFPNVRQRSVPGDRDDRPVYALFPGQFVQIRVKGYMRMNALLVPQRAVQQGAQGTFVYVIDGENKAELRPITASAWHGQNWLIDEGLQAGEQVVVEGFHRVRPGAQVSPVPFHSPADSSVTPPVDADRVEES